MHLHLLWLILRCLRKDRAPAEGAHHLAQKRPSRGGKGNDKKPLLAAFCSLVADWRKDEFKKSASPLGDYASFRGEVGKDLGLR